MVQALAPEKLKTVRAKIAYMAQLNMLLSRMLEGDKMKIPPASGAIQTTQNKILKVATDIDKTLGYNGGR